MNLGYILQILIALFFFAVGLCVSQVSVIHFNSEWNAENSFNIDELNDCEKSDVVICDSPELKDKHKILSVPTILIFYNKEVVERYDADLTFQLCIKAPKKKVEELVLKKFM